MGVAFVVGVVIVVVDNVFPKAKPYTPSPAALGIAMTIPAYQGFAMFLGALIVWILEKKAAKWNDMYTIPDRLRLHRRREHHGRDPRGAGGDGPDALIRRRTVIARFWWGSRPRRVPLLACPAVPMRRPTTLLGKPAVAPENPFAPFRNGNIFAGKSRFGVIFPLARRLIL